MKNKFTSLQSQAGLSNEQAANLLKVSLRTIERWRAKEAPHAAVMCLESLVSGNAVHNPKSVHKVIEPAYQDNTQHFGEDV